MLSLCGSSTDYWMYPIDNDSAATQWNGRVLHGAHRSAMRTRSIIDAELPRVNGKLASGTRKQDW